MIPFEEYAARQKIRREEVGNAVWSLLEKVYRDGYDLGRDNHPDPRYRALRAKNRALRGLNKILKTFARELDSKLIGIKRDLEDMESPLTTFEPSSTTDRIKP